MKKYIIYFLVATSVVSVSGCKDYLNINTNPNQLTITKPDFILSGAIVQSANIKLGNDFNGAFGQWSGYYSASGSYSQSGDIVRTYILTNAYSNTVWGDLYANLSNYNYVEQNVAALKGYDNYIAICEIMKVHNFAALVDIFGDVPYKQTLTGFQILYPAYDPAQSIYTNLSLKLDSAIGIIQSATAAVSVPPSTDVMFGGDMKKWIQFANTLNLRLLIHQSNVYDATFTSAEFAKIAANTPGQGKFIGSDDHNAEDAVINPGYAALAGLQSPLWENYGEAANGTVGGRDYLRLSIFSLNTLSGLSDPRAVRLWRAPGDNPGVTSAAGISDLKGVGFGDLPATANNSANTSGWGPGIVTSPVQSAVFFSAAESLFLQAEAKQRGWTIPVSEDPQTLYERGVYESFRLLSVGKDTLTDHTAATAYLTSGKVNADWSASPNKLAAIITQKWIADWGFDALEAWVDERRLNLPAGIPVSNDPTKVATTINPRHLLYPQTELNNNATNLGKVPVTGIFDSAIFWDK